MITSDKITAIFVLVDDFCKDFQKTLEGHSLPKQGGKKPRNRSRTLSDSEVITILILFHSMGYRNLKHFYLYYVCKHMKSEFPQTVSYNRFVELQQKAILPMAIFLKKCRLGSCTGVSFIDSTPLRHAILGAKGNTKHLKMWQQKGNAQSVGFMVLNCI